MERIIICSNYTILFNYLKKYKLKSNKMINFKRFERIWIYKNLSQEDYQKILSNPRAFKKLKRLISSTI
jgi:hypothetical protein